jgi:tripartite motif-containing protein 71
MTSVGDKVSLIQGSDGKYYAKSSGSVSVGDTVQVFMGSDGKYYASKSGTPTVGSSVLLSMDSKGKYIAHVSYTPTNQTFSDPQGLAMYGSYIFVCDGDHTRVVKFDSDGNYVSTFGSAGTGDGQFSWNRGIAIDTQGNIYISDTTNNRIEKFDAAGNFLLKWGSYGTGNSQFISAVAICCDSSDNVYVGESYYSGVYSNYNHRVQKFDSSGNYITQWGSYGIGHGNFNGITGIASDTSDNIWVMDLYNYRLQKFDSAGTFILTTGHNGSTDGNFGGGPYTAHIICDSSGNVFVTDRGNSRIQKFDQYGNYVAKWSNTDAFGICSYTTTATKIYAAGTVSNSITRYTDSGATELSWSTWVG